MSGLANWLVRNLAWMLAIAMGIPMTNGHAHTVEPTLRGYEIIRMSDLEFGTIVAGTRTDVRHSDPGAAKFRVRRLDGSERVRLQFILPSATVLAESGVQLSFSGRSAAWADHDDSSGRTSFDPHEPLHLSIPPDGDLFVWLGGTLALSSTAEALSDPTAIVLTVASE